jgi:hypothetical protein
MKSIKKIEELFKILPLEDLLVNNELKIFIKEFEKENPGHSINVLVDLEKGIATLNWSCGK